MLLRAISPNDPVTALVLQGLEKTAPILQDIQFYSKSGSADSVKRKREGSTTDIFRAINTSNSPTPPTNTYDAVTKKIVSFDAKVDVVLEDRNEDLEAELAFQTRAEAESAGYVLQEKIFEGDVDDDATEFNGLRELVNASWIKEIATDGIELSLGNDNASVTNQQLAIEALLRHFAIVRGGASHAYMNEYLKIRLLTIAKNLGYYRMSKDELGNMIETIGNTIIRGAGYKEDGTVLLPFDETVGGNTDCSSMFLVRWGERVDLTALTSVGVKARYAGQTGNFITNNVNLDMALHIQNLAALVQVKGWRL